MSRGSCDPRETHERPQDHQGNGKRTLVEEGTRFKGSMSSTCPILVQGEIAGDVDGPALTVSATGAVSGVVVTAALQSDGKISASSMSRRHASRVPVADKTVVRASSLDLKLNATKGKLQLTFGPRVDVDEALLIVDLPGGGLSIHAEDHGVSGQRPGRE